VICVAEFTVNAAALEPRLTELAPVKFVPVSVTVEAAKPLVGLKLVSVGGEAVTVKVATLVAVPPAVVTLHLAEAAPAGTDAVICVAEFTVKVAVTEPSLTELAPVKFVPVNVTLAPTGPLDGEKPDTVGAGGGAVTVKLPELVAVPPGVVTLH
jgi:hypothetical protein